MIYTATKENKEITFAINENPGVDILFLDPSEDNLFFDADSALAVVYLIPYGPRSDEVALPPPALPPPAPTGGRAAAGPSSRSIPV